MGINFSRSLKLSFLRIFNYVKIFCIQNYRYFLGCENAQFPPTNTFFLWGVRLWQLRVCSWSLSKGKYHVHSCKLSGFDHFALAFLHTHVEAQLILIYKLERTNVSEVTCIMDLLHEPNSVTFLKSLWWLNTSTMMTWSRTTIWISDAGSVFSFSRHLNMLVV